MTDETAKKRRRARIRNQVFERVTGTKARMRKKGTYKLLTGLVARDGIEPPTHGFSVYMSDIAILNSM
jgi:hypothetical protein